MEELDFTAELQRALDAVGLDELAERLDVSAKLVRLWSHGLAAIPLRQVVLLIDLLLDVSAAEPLPYLD